MELPIISQQPLIPEQPPTTVLQLLTSLSKVEVHEIMQPVEILADWGTAKRYQIRNENGEQCYDVLEESDGSERRFCGSQRGFVMHINNALKAEVLTVKREFRCCGGCCYGCCACVGCCQHDCVVESPTLGTLGTIRQRFGFLTTSFDVMDGKGARIFRIEIPFWKLMGFQDKEFSIKNIDDGTEIGKIIRKTARLAGEPIVFKKYTINFPTDLDVKLKAVLMGATFLIVNNFLEFQQIHDVDESTIGCGGSSYVRCCPIC
ncbi:Phospholipid scramblase [Caenorhabditis elegans]|uniref:Phospholipid scramblase n=1 Tax=Caenorhabditis elegans TaxID=6239 RepID=O62149_CAEEL|nr:Phospholipid scramblase [Caenorhabditis elegans]CAB04084.3 Phospholipid scramblase [Caenorhabditis elegans]|eukprot:NP_492975.3 Phospholipid scramblase [Caenorhabditis elegans]